MRILRYILFCFSLLSIFNASAQSATEVMSKAAAKTKAAKGIIGTFSVATSKGNFSGSLKANGSKFAFMTPTVSSWYNGKNLWTYNSASKETTLVTPTASEISESNPLEYLRTYSANYSAFFSKKKANGKYIVNLLPKSKRNSIKSVEITINAKSLKPEKFVIIPKAGDKTTISVKSLDYTRSVKDSEFEYPKSKYPKIQIIDLR